MAAGAAANVAAASLRINMSIEDEIRASLQDWGREIKSWLPDGFGFILLVAEHGEKGTMLYTASINRADALQAMREFIAVNMEERNWQREMPELESDEEFEAWWQNNFLRSPDYLDNPNIRQMCRDAFLAGRSTA